MGSETGFTPNAFKRLYEEIARLPETVGIVGPVTNKAGTAQQLHFTNQNRDLIFQD